MPTPPLLGALSEGFYGPNGSIQCRAWMSREDLVPFLPSPPITPRITLIRGPLLEATPSHVPPPKRGLLLTCPLPNIHVTLLLLLACRPSVDECCVLTLCTADICAPALANLSVSSFVVPINMSNLEKAYLQGDHGTCILPNIMMHDWLLAPRVPLSVIILCYVLQNMHAPLGFFVYPDILVAVHQLQSRLRCWQSCIFICLSPRTPQKGRTPHTLPSVH